MLTVIYLSPVRAALHDHVPWAHRISCLRVAVDAMKFKAPGSIKVPEHESSRCVSMPALSSAPTYGKSRPPELGTQPSEPRLHFGVQSSAESYLIALVHSVSRLTSNHEMSLHHEPWR